MLTITNNEDQPLILRNIRVDVEGEEIDCRSETQLLPAQTADFEILEGESLVVFRR